MNEQEFKEYEKSIDLYINEEILKSYPNLINYSVHFLPNLIQNDIEFIFQIRPNLSNTQIKNLLHDVYRKMFRCYDNLNLKYDFIIVFTE